MSDACGCDDDRESDEPEQEEPAAWWQVREIRAAAVAGVLLVGGFVAARAGAPGPVATACNWAALLVGGYTFVPGTVRRLARGRIGVGTLMTIAAVGATLLGEVGEAAMLAFLYSISEGLEEYSVARTRHGLRALLSLVPQEATILGADNSQRLVALADLAVGDRMLVRPGERVATDGIVRAGRSALDNAALTGESVPVEAGLGDSVYAGAINGTGTLEVQVTSTAENNSLAKIVAIVEREQARKGAGQRLADRIAKPLVPGIMILAALIAVTGSLLGEPRTWIERALVVLVAASPCALAIAVPVTVVAAIGAASRIGALVKGGAALEGLGAIRTLALDKTGTLTRNTPTVIDVAATEGTSPDHVLAMAAALEARSEHPLARAILAAVPNPPPAADVQAVTGAGLVGTVAGHRIRLGRPGWLPAGDLTARVAAMQEAGATAVLLEENGIVIGAIAVRDELRPEAAEVVARLHADGYTVAMLTGDNGLTAAALAREAGIEQVHADLRPEDKSAIIARLRATQPTAMVGDGVNDAPALAAADIGIAMGAMVQNVGLSLALITVLIPLAAFGVLGLATVVLIHELAEILVIGNGVRAGRVRPLPPFTAPQATVRTLSGATP